MDSSFQDSCTDMNMLYVVVLAFCFLFLVFRPLELVFPAKPAQRFFRPAWLTDLCFFVSYYSIWGIIVIWLLVHLRPWMGGIVPEAFRNAVAEQPCWLQA